MKISFIYLILSCLFLIWGFQGMEKAEGDMEIGDRKSSLDGVDSAYVACRWAILG